MEPSKLLSRFRESQAYVGWTAADAARLRDLQAIVGPRLAQIVGDFYAAIEHYEQTRRLITGGADQVARLRARLAEWIMQLLSDDHDESYVAQRWRVGWRHVEIGLPQQFTIVAMGRLRSSLASVVRDHWSGDDADLHASLLALHRALDLDLVLIEDAYQFEFQQRQQRSDRLVALGQMAAGIAHELRNPLNVVRTSAFYLRHAGQVADEKWAEHMDRIERQIEVADGVIRALSDFARTPLPDFQPVELRRLLTAAINRTPTPATVAIDQSGVPETLRVRGDFGQLTIVFANLLRNAVEAMGDAGRIRLAATRQRDRVEVTIDDTGPGISADQLGQIFQPFFTTKTRGIGLGLAIARAIVENHGGSLMATSVVGQGSCFLVRLPAATVLEAVAP
jgi:signal transduction histidine kinase